MESRTNRACMYRLTRYFANFAPFFSHLLHDCPSLEWPLLARGFTSRVRSFGFYPKKGKALPIVVMGRSLAPAGGNNDANLCLFVLIFGQRGALLRRSGCRRLSSTAVWQKWRFSAPQTHLWLIKPWCWVWSAARLCLYSADPFVVNQTLVLRISICGKIRQLRQAAKRLVQA